MSLLCSLCMCRCHGNARCAIASSSAVSHVVATRETLKSVCGFTIRNSVNEFPEDVALKMVMLKFYCSDVTAKHSRAMSWNSTCVTMTDERRDGVSRKFLRSSEPKMDPPPVFGVLHRRRLCIRVLTLFCKFIADRPILVSPSNSDIG